MKKELSNFINITKYLNLIFSSLSCNIVFILFFSVLTYGQSTIEDKNINRQRSIAILNLSEQVKWPNIDEIEIFRIGILGSDSVKNQLSKFLRNKRLFNKRVEVENIYGLEDIKNINVVYLNTTYEYLLKDILEIWLSPKISL